MTEVSPGRTPVPPTQARADGPRLVADVGGTNARMALLGEEGHQLHRIQVLRCAEHASLEEAIRAYIDAQGLGELGGICVAVAGPVDGDEVHLPNSGWRFSRRAMAERFGVPFEVINDFTAQALSLDLLTPDHFSWIGDVPARAGGVQGIIGPGTGLGVAVRMPDGRVLPSEGGHVGFAPTTDKEIEVLRLLLARYGRVSAERLVSGRGLENLFWAEAVMAGEVGADSEPSIPAEEISRMAARGEPLALGVVRDFFDLLGSFAGDVALAHWTNGGVFLSGGVLRKLWGFFDPVRFRDRFEAKGRFRSFCERVPVAWITADYPGLLGCAAALLRSPGGRS